MHNDLVGSARMDVEGDCDKLSRLPDDVIHKILSDISIKDVIGTNVLSSRWRFIWTSMPYLNFENLNHRPHHSEFVSNVLSHRDNRTQVFSVKLDLGREVTDDASIRIILNCVSSHNIQQFTVTRVTPGLIFEYPYSSVVTPMWDLPSLTTLQLHHVRLYVKFDDSESLFSKCPNLKNLFLRKCSIMKGKNVLNILHPRLSNLRLEYTPANREYEETVNVVAPQLKSLTIKWCEGKHVISAPGVTSLVIEGFQPWQLSTPVAFRSLEKVRLHMYDPCQADAHEIVRLLQQLHGVKRLRLNLGILERLFSQSKSLSSSMELIPRKACALANAKISKFITNPTVKIYLEVRAQQKVSKATFIDNNFGTCPLSIFPMVSCEEITVMRDMASAREFVYNLGLLLQQYNVVTDIDTNKAHIDEDGKPLVYMDWVWELQWNLEVIMGLIQRKSVRIRNCFMMAWINETYIGRSETPPIIAWLQEASSLFVGIERLMITQLSPSKRAVMQPAFSSLCEDATILTNNMLEWMKDLKMIQETNKIIFDFDE